MFGIIISFKEYQPFMGVEGIFTSEWVGLKHFQKFFNSYYFWDILGNTLAISLLKFIFGFPAPIIFALLLNEVRNKKFMKTVQTISYLPHFLSWVVVSGLLVTLLSTDHGLINIIRRSHGQRIITNRWRRIWHITLPSISHIVVIMLIFSVGGLLNAGFEQIFLLYSPAVYSVANIIDTFVYREGLQSNNYSYATAVGLFKSLVSMFLLLLTNFIAKRLDQEGIW